MGLSYVSSRHIKVESRCLALTYYTTALMMLAYVVGYSIIIKKGYHGYDDLIGGARIKVKGSALGTHVGEKGNPKVFDAIDLVSHGEMWTTIATNQILTAGQTPGVCNGDIKEGLCDCPEGSLEKCCPKGQRSSNGVLTGKCGSKGKFCQIQSWCPLETEYADEDLPKYALDEVKDFTLFVQVDAAFPKYNVTRSNVVNQDADLIPGVNLWSIGELVVMSGGNWTLLSAKGGRIDMLFKYDCDLDHDESDCNAVVEVVNLQDVGADISAAGGYNRRDAESYMLDGNHMRDVTKSYGISFTVRVFGRAGKFSLVATTMTLGAGLGLMSLATVVCDFLLRYVVAGRDTFKSAKYEVVTAACCEDDGPKESDALLGDEEQPPGGLST